ncbi:MAG: 50S ribosomal protein L32 [Deltaproteobacteria bacterium]|jgi:large subunit ribosomal protein L32|nr:50S ribosomal protein L32 [Deltaproteobacteria bacterium]
MPNPIKRHSKSRRNMRRAHDFLKPVPATACPQCRSPKLPHRVCPTCGTYKGREIVPIEKAS